MKQNDDFPHLEEPQKKAKSSNVKFSKKYECFGEIIRYLTVDELNQSFTMCPVSKYEMHSSRILTIKLLSRAHNGCGHIK